MKDPRNEKCDICQENDAIAEINGDFYCEECYENQFGSLIFNDNDDDD